MFSRASAQTALVIVIALSSVHAAAQQDQIDWNKARLLHQRFLRGEKLTDEELAYHDRAAQALRTKTAAKRQTVQPSKPPVGLKPLSDMTADDRYKEQDGGLYGGGSNRPPEKHLQAGLQQSRLIQDQIKGDPKLNYDPAKGLERSPLLLWGPYLWADGEEGRKLDDLVWKPEDLGPDGTHPSDSGRRKVADLLLRFVKRDPTAKIWFTKSDD